MCDNITIHTEITYTFTYMTIHTLKHTLAALALSTFMLGCTNGANNATQQRDLKVATWNIEHLATNNGLGCKARQDLDYAALSRYKDQVQADIYALQEVDSIAAIERVFDSSEWQVFISNRSDTKPYTCRESGRQSTQQKVAYAIRKNIPVSDVLHLSSLSEPQFGLRHGLKLSVRYANQEISLINVHLKSGCFVNNYAKNDKKSCKLLAQQATILENIIKEESRNSTSLIVLGDFNHHLANQTNVLRAKLGIAEQTMLLNTTDGVTGCHPKYPAPIDHILVSPDLAQYVGTNKTEFHYFSNMEPEQMLSDHCAATLTLSLN